MLRCPTPDFELSVFEYVPKISIHSSAPSDGFRIYSRGLCAQAGEVRGDRMPCVAGAEHAAPEHHLESSWHDEQLLVPLQGVDHAALYGTVP